MPKLFISAGHSNTDPGAVSNGTTEFAQVSKIAKESVKVLRDQGVQAVLVPVGINLQERIAWVNENAIEEDSLFELHLNAASPKAAGAEVFYYSGSEESKERSLRLLSGYIENTPLTSRGAKPDTATRFGRLGIIRDTKPWSYLLELGFITNLSDLDKVRRYGVDGVVAGAKKLIGFEEKQEVSAWAVESVEKAKEKGIATVWDNPQEIVGTATMEYIFKNLGVLSKVTGDGLTKERMIVCLDRLGHLD